MPKTEGTTVLKSGNSLVVVVPAKFARRIGAKSGDKVKVKIDLEKGEITYTFIDMRQLTLV